MAGTSLLAALIPALVNRGVLTQQDTNEIYENALMTLEMQQGADPVVQRVYEAAREWIKAQCHQTPPLPAESSNHDVSAALEISCISGHRSTDLVTSALVALLVRRCWRLC